MVDLMVEGGTEAQALRCSYIRVWFILSILPQPDLNSTQTASLTV